MKILSCNVNGVRSAYKKGLINLLETEKPDILCLQEIKAQEKDFPSDLFAIKDYKCIINSAEKKGYSGVAVFSKEKPLRVNTRLGYNRFDSEGRLLELEYPDFILLNLYIPHGGRKKENIKYKLETYKLLFEKIKMYEGKKVVLIGDFNIAHKDIDLARPDQNRNNIMFTPEERAQLDTLANIGFVDSFRMFNSNPGNYSWWPYSFYARERNMGWRIDYAFVSDYFSEEVKSAAIYPSICLSDHCPIGIEI